MMMMTMLALFPFRLSATCDFAGGSDLSDSYYDIFKTGNRNAASHLWTSFILQRSDECDMDTLDAMFRSFCPISGSPLPDAPHTQYSVSLRKVGGGEVEGISHHCCWPCICDMQEMVWVDTMTVNTSSGPVRRNALVVGDPCASSDSSMALSKPFVDPFSGNKETLVQSAPEVKCTDGKLAGAFFSDHGHPIIGMFFDVDSVVPGTTPARSETFAPQCMKRESEGYNSGMGLIFHRVASINPISLMALPQNWASVAGIQAHTTGVNIALVAVLATMGIVMVSLRFASVQKTTAEVELAPSVQKTTSEVELAPFVNI